MDKKMRDSDLVLPENFHKTERCQKGLKSESITSRNSFLLKTRGFSLSFKASSFIYFTEELLRYCSLSLVKFYSHASIENRVIFVKIQLIYNHFFIDMIH